MTAREELIKELKNKTFLPDDYDCVEACADFILADRKRIVEPLVNRKKDVKIPIHTKKAIEETLKLAGEL